MTGDEYDFTEVFQAIFIPKQKPAPEPVAPEMRAAAACYPPLGQVTQFPAGEVPIIAVLEIHESRSNEPWRVALWRSIDGGDWSETVLSRAEEEDVPVSLQASDPSVYRIYFRGSVSIQKSVNFTLRFRRDDEKDWTWARDEVGMNDGIVVVETPVDAFSDVLSDYIKDLNPKLQTKSLMSQSPRTKLWSLEASVSKAGDKESSFTYLDIGMPWGSFLRWFSLVRLWAPWLAPRQGKTRFELDKDAILSAFLGPEGKHIVFLGMSGLNDVSTVFRNSDSGNIVMKARNDGTSPEPAIVLVAVGDEVENAIAAVMYHARTLVMNSKQASHELEKEIEALAKNVDATEMLNWYDGLGYCTWNALGQKLTSQKIYDALDVLAENKIDITSLIIDDNWQSIDYQGDGQFQYGWLDFEAEPTAFPEGLKATINQIRLKHHHIRHIAVWHALLGYWGGINPEGPLAKKYKTVKVEREEQDRRNLPLGGPMTVVASEDVHRFYADFYTFLSHCGVSGVKTDAQFMPDIFMVPADRRNLIHSYSDAWTLASLRYFHSRALSCMSQTPFNLFYAQLPSSRPAMLCRNSDDFFPEIESSHCWHVWANAHNALLTQHLNVLPDWDMFQTVHSYSGFHAAARAVSGGPIYITDVPGEHNIPLIKQLCGVNVWGRTAVFRPSVVGRSVDVYAGYGDDVLCKVGAYHGRAGGSGMLGVFNISTRAVTEIVNLAKFPGVVKGLQYVLRAHSSGRVSKEPVRVGENKALITVGLEVRGWEIFTAYPTTAFEGRKEGQEWTTTHVAVLGLVDKMAAAATVTGHSIKMLENGRISVDVTLKALGSLGIYISRLPSLSVDDKFLVTIMGQVVPRHTVSINSEKSNQVLEIDIETAWNEMGLRHGWSNDVQVKIFFGLD